jgi:hypothetical protein
MAAIALSVAVCLCGKPAFPATGWDIFLPLE